MREQLKKMRRGTRLWHACGRTVEMRDAARRTPPGRRCMHRHSTGSEPAKLAASHSPPSLLLGLVLALLARFVSWPTT
jgi:hypothetical protein